MWWHNAVIYEIYVRSFSDSDGDGIGDIRGIINRLGYLKWLGVDALWLTPITVSPNYDYGYDVADYFNVDPTLGTLADVDALIEEAGRRDIKIMLDLVPNHTSAEHPWFRDAQKRRNYYVWSNQPNNWISTFHISSWTYDEREGLYYLHSYLPSQPDLDWWNEEVRAEFDKILRYWFDRGVAGFRIDACYIIVKDQLLRDNPVVEPHDHPWDRNRGQRPVWSAHQPEVHNVLKRWRKIAEEYSPPRLLMGATWVPEVAELVRYFGADDELQLPQYFQFLFCAFEPQKLRQTVEGWLAALPEGSIPVWTASSHDLSRFPSRWCEADDFLIRTALKMLLTLPGACVLYQGDELGLQDTILSPGHRSDFAQLYRDAYRTPMPWSDTPNGGFTTGTPWLPLGDVPSCNVAQQIRDTGSILHYTRRLITTKKALSGSYRFLDASNETWTYLRGNVRVDLNFRPSRPT
jgi:alpha-glucosidase